MKILKRFLKPERRKLNAFYAIWMGYYWAPCKMCGEYFGGHEDHGVLMRDWNTGDSVCYNCAEKAQRRNQELLKSNPPPVFIYSRQELFRKRGIGG